MTDRISVKEYRAMSRTEKRDFRRSGGKLNYTWKDRAGMTLAVVMLGLVAGAVSLPSGKPSAPQDTAKYSCLAAGVNGIEGLKPDYNSVDVWREGPRYVVTYSLKAPNLVGRMVPGQIHCETDLTGTAVLLINISSSGR